MCDMVALLPFQSSILQTTMSFFLNPEVASPEVAEAVHWYQEVDNEEGEGFQREE